MDTSNRKSNSRIMRLSEVMAFTGLSRSTLYALQKLGDFPAAIKLSERSVGWLEVELVLWIEQRANKRSTPLSDTDQGV